MEKGSRAERLVLGIETASKTGSLAILAADVVIAGSEFAAGETVSELLLPRIGEMIAEAGRSLLEVDLIAVVTGPGSLTGVRVGLAAAAGLAKGLGVRCAGVSAFEALLPETDDGPATLLLVAAGKMVAWELLRNGERCQDGVCTEEEFLVVIGETEPSRVICTGDASDKIKDLPSVEVVRNMAIGAALRAHRIASRELAASFLKPVYTKGPSFRRVLTDPVDEKM
jgi:tRNA threonylcarbamoyladenosine biosynthesis protein TsaB